VGDGFGRSRGGLSAKIHLAVDRRGRPLRVLMAACEAWREHNNAQVVHSETAAAPVDRLAIKRAHLHVLPAAAVLGEERLVTTSRARCR
jgi:hypothetical protein